MSNAEIFIHAFMTSRLDYSNALLGGCSAHLINKLQMVQNAAARVLTRTRKYDHISPVMSTLHWLPIKHRIDFKILLITYKALNGLAPQCLRELLSHYSPPCPLRSQNSGHLIIARISKSTACGRSFFYLEPKLWNCHDRAPLSDSLLPLTATCGGLFTSCHRLPHVGEQSVLIHSTERSISLTPVTHLPFPIYSGLCPLSVSVCHLWFVLPVVGDLLSLNCILCPGSPGEE